MRNSLIFKIALATGLFLFGMAPSSASFFYDNFDHEPGSGHGASGESGLDMLSLTNWNVATGTVDLLAHGDFGIGCWGDGGKCVDLDGSSGDAGIFVSTRQTLLPGRYAFQYALAGVAEVFRSPAAMAPNVVDVSVGDFYAAQIVREHGDPFQVFRGVFEVKEPTVVFIVFENPGDDNFGALLDEVRLSVPEPYGATAAVLGCLGWGLGRRCRMRRDYVASSGVRARCLESFKVRGSSRCCAK